MIRIVIAEDQHMLRGAFASLLQLEDDIDIIAQVSDGGEALRMIEACNPDLCLLDIEMPGLTGLEVAAAVRRSGLPCKITIVTTFARPGYLQQAMDASVDAYLLKDEPIEFLIEAIRKVMQGGRVVSPYLAASLFTREANPLTEREQDVLRMAAGGATTRQIAGSLHLTTGTVRNYLSSAIQKLEVETRHHAVQKAKERGWI
ncbi:response regulator transcription factor [Paenibacillus tarimensis]|uniref:response regulator transcription factor n=1 Tax=Paenibacillus tarimensis TaxID=416012 RepID=UPI001F3A4037|nr:response regulator transcription factor [Paenibacillus tarimensis]MCF2945108.1 response regulator transcription factor [Paenibacillus tarimensis]